MKTVELHSNKLNVLLLFQTAPLRVDGQRRPVSATILQRRQFNITSKAGLGKCWPVKSYHGQLSISDKLPKKKEGKREEETWKKGRREGGRGKGIRARARIPNDNILAMTHTNSHSSQQHQCRYFPHKLETCVRVKSLYPESVHIHVSLDWVFFSQLISKST